MKKIISLLLLCVVFSLSLVAQQREPRMRDGRPEPRPHFNIEEYFNSKTNAVVHELGLNPQDSSRFVPVYRELLQQKAQLYRKFGGGRNVRRMLENGEQIQDTTLMRVVKNQAQLQAEDAQLELRFVERFSKVLSPLQLYKLQLAEQKFKTEMMKRGKPARK